MKKLKALFSSIILTLFVLNNLMPITSFAADNTTAGNTAGTSGQTEATQESTEQEEIGRDYEIKDEETWDVSKNGDRSVIAKWRLDDRSLTISGSGEMKDWTDSSIEDWHGTQYTNAIEKVVIENGVTKIGEDAFNLCESLTNIEISNSVTNIGDFAFYGCSILTNIQIPNSVTNIGDRVFRFCSNLREINVDNENQQYKSINGVLFSKDSKTLILFPAGKNDSSYEIPNSVISLEDDAFFCCKNIMNIEIPSSVTNIGEDAFYDCSKLTNIEIPSSVINIGENAFYDCSSLRNIVIPNSITNIKKETFYGCSSITNIEIPNSVTSIGSNAFGGCSSLREINVGNENQKYISINGVLFNKNKTALIAFPPGKNDSSYEIPNSVTEIGLNAFYKCSSLKNIEIPNNVTTIDERAFYDYIGIIICNTNSEAHRYAESKKISYFLLENSNSNYETEYEIKNEETWDVSENNDGSVIAKWTLSNRTVTISGNGKMKKWDFASNEDWHNSKYQKIIEKVIIEDGIINIGMYAFKDCRSLANIEIPNSVTLLESYSFMYCRGLTNIVIPNGVKYIETGVFENCSSLTSIEIPNSVIDIYIYTFSGCTNLKEIKVDKNNNKYTDVDGVLYNKEKNEILRYPPKKEGKSYIIPNGVVKIGWHAFEDCSSLTNIEIPNSVISIGYYTFEGCSSLTNINIPEGVDNIGNSAFSNCSSLTNVKIPNSVTSIERYAFSSCSSLTNITIPNSVTSIEEKAFWSCKGPIICRVDSNLHKYAENEEEGYVLYITGDINRDKKTDIVDLARCMKVVLGKRQLDTIEGLAADTNFDGKVNIIDLAKIRKLSLNN